MVSQRLSPISLGRHPPTLSSPLLISLWNGWPPTSRPGGPSPIILMGTVLGLCQYCSVVIKECQMTFLPPRLHLGRSAHTSVQPGTGQVLFFFLERTFSISPAGCRFKNGFSNVRSTRGGLKQMRSFSDFGFFSSLSTFITGGPRDSLSLTNKQFQCTPLPEGSTLQ